MEFKLWLETSFKDLLEPVPQNPEHHAEGNVLKHTRMVRKSLDTVKNLLSKESNKFPFKNINFNLNNKEEKILKMAAWLHDIGKASATTIGGKHWSNGGEGKIQAIDHQKSNHYLPMIDKLHPTVKDMLNTLSQDELSDLYFCIDNHMNLRDGKLSRRLGNLILDKDGNYKNERRIKILIYLIIMDRTGRISGEKGGINGAMVALAGFKDSAIAFKEKHSRLN